MALIIALVNISDLAEISDYRYEILVGDGSAARSTCIERGVVRGHARSEGWEALVRRLLTSREVGSVNRWTVMAPSRPAEEPQ